MNTNKCIFCLTESGDFNTIEHIVPESLGNNDDILEKAVCDKCQNYFGTEIEHYILTKTPFAFWRTLAGIKTKKGKKPHFNLSQFKKGHRRIDDYHSITDNNIIIHPADGESIVEIEINDEDVYLKVQSGEKSNFKLALTPKMLIYIGRFLGKMALEYWYMNFGEKVFSSQFDELRTYVRYGTVNSIYPVMLSQLNKNLLNYKAVDEFTEERILYKYSFFEDENSGMIIFNFDIGSERYSIVMNCKFPKGEDFSEQIIFSQLQDVKGLPQILFYDNINKG